MRFRERRDEEREPQPGQPATGPSPARGNLTRLRVRGEGLLAAGADAINRTLSGDSEAFNTATRQQGGQ